jgi:glutaminyl-tRNA synthetase
MIGVAKANSMVDIGKLEYCVRDDLNRTAPRVLGVLRPIEVEVTGDVPVRTVDAPYFPPDVGKEGARALPVGARIYIDRDDWSDAPPADWKRLAPGRTVRLRHAYCIGDAEVVARGADGVPTKLRARIVEGGKGLGVIHWVDAATSVAAEVRLYDRLFKSPKPEEGGADFLAQLDPASLEIVKGARVEASLAKAAVGSRWQLERVGYFRVDEDSRPGALVLNRITTLREREAAPAGKEPAEAPEARVKKQNAKAQTRPKSKSPAEYRAEARARDPELARVYADAQARGLSAEQADLVAADRASAALFAGAAERTGDAALVAKWMINELPRALDGKTVADAGLDAARFAELIALLQGGSITAAIGKSVLGQMVATGKRAGELASAHAAAPAVDLGAAVDAAIAANPDKAAQYKAGRTGLLGFFVGQIMKASPGADAAAVSQAVKDRLG